MARSTNDANIPQNLWNEVPSGLEGQMTSSLSISGDALPVTYLNSEDGETLSLPSRDFVTDAQMFQNGLDLHLELPNGETVIVEGYFDQIVKPTLVAEGELNLTPELVDSFILPVAPGQVAELTDGHAGDPIGTIEFMSGSVVAIRTDGTRVELKLGDPVYQGDQIQTDGNGSVKMRFVDETIFTLGENARLALDELVYDSTADAGQTAFSILKGSFVFMSGNIAHNNYDDMTVTSPVATIGIRGTTVSGSVLVGDQAFTFSLLEGSIIVTSGNESVILTESFDTVVGEYSTDGSILISETDRDPQEVISHSKSAFGALSPSDIERLEKIIESEIKADTGENIDVDLNALIKTAGVEGDKLNDGPEELTQQADADAPKLQLDDSDLGDEASGDSAGDGIEDLAELSEEELEELAELLDDIETAAGGDDLDEFSDDVTTVVEDGGTGFDSNGNDEDGGESGATQVGATDSGGSTGSDDSDSGSLFSFFSPRNDDDPSFAPNQGGASPFNIDFSNSNVGARNIIANNVINDDNIRGSVHGDTLSGGGGNDYLYSGAGDDTVSGGSGDDIIQGGTGAGNDFYDGGQGVDSLIYPSVREGQTLEVQLGAGVVSEDSEFWSEDIREVSGDEVIGEVYGTVTDGEGSATNYVDNDVFVNMTNIELGADNDIVYVNNADFSEAMNIDIDGKNGVDTVVYQDFENVLLEFNGEKATATYDGITQSLTNVERIIGDTEFSISYDGNNSELSVDKDGLSGTLSANDTVTLGNNSDDGSLEIDLNLTNQGTIQFQGNTSISGFNIANNDGTLIVETGASLHVADGELNGTVIVKEDANLYIDSGILNAAITIEDGGAVYLSSEADAIEFGDVEFKLEGDGAVYLDDAVLEIDGDLSFGGEFNQGTLVLSDSVIDLNGDLPNGIGGDIDHTNVRDDDSGFNVTAYTVNDQGNIVEGSISTGRGKSGQSFGVSGVDAAGVDKQLGYDFQNQASESVEIEFDHAVSSATVDVTNLYHGEGRKITGSSNSHEQGQWAVYSEGVLLATGVFIATIGNNKATIEIDVDADFDKLVLSATEYAGGQDRGSDSSDYWIHNISYEWARQDEVTLDATLRIEGDSSIAGNVDATQGTLEFVEGSTLTVTGELDVSGLTAISGSGVLNATGGLNVTAGSFVVPEQLTLMSSSVTVADNAVFELTGVLENDGVVSGGEDSQFIMQDSATLISTSHDGVLGAVDFSDGSFNAAGTMELRIGDDVNIAQSDLSFVNAGEISGSFHDLYVLNADGSDTYFSLNDDEEKVVGLVSRDEDSFDFQLVVADSDGSGSAGDDVFAGGAGNDAASSGTAGQDVFYGFAGNDVFTLSNAGFGDNKSGYADGGQGGMDTLVLDGVDANFDLWQVNGFEVLDVTNASESFGANDLTEDLVLGLTEDQNAALTDAVGNDGAANALILFDADNMDMAGSEFTSTGEVVQLNNLGDYSGSYSIYEAGDAKLYVHQPESEVA